MKPNHIAIVILLALVAMASPGWAAQAPGDGPQGDPAAIPALSAQILAPAGGSKLEQNFVQVKFALTHPEAVTGGSIAFVLQLDQRQPVITTASEYLFNDLTPGMHTIKLTSVDANGNPLSGSSSQVSFSVARSRRKANPNAVLAQGSEGESSPDPSDPAAPLPAAGGALPLLSVIGFGVLLGGIASAMKTR